MTNDFLISRTAELVARALFQGDHSGSSWDDATVGTRNAYRDAALDFIEKNEPPLRAK